MGLCADRKHCPSIAADIVINEYQVFGYGFSRTNGYNEIWMNRHLGTEAERAHAVK